MAKMLQIADAARSSLSTAADLTNCPNVPEMSRGLSIAELMEQNRRRRDEIRPRIFAQYGEVSDRDLMTIDRAEREAALCVGCNGNCSKTVGRWGKPFVVVEDGNVYVKVALCKFGQMNRLRREGKLAQIPLKYIGKTFADYRETTDNSEAVQIAHWLVDEKPQRGAFFYGDVGTGKTLLAAIVAQEYLRDFRTVIFGDMPSLLTDIKGTFGTGKTSELLERMIGVDLLVLDDIGAEKVTDWSAEQLYLLINGRYNGDKPVIVTSNFDFKGLINRLSLDDKGNVDPNRLVLAKRITSRLNEMTVQTFFGTKDWRN